MRGKRPTRSRVQFKLWGWSRIRSETASNCRLAYFLPARAAVNFMGCCAASKIFKICARTSCGTVSHASTIWGNSRVIQACRIAPGTCADCAGSGAAGRSASVGGHCDRGKSAADDRADGTAPAPRDRLNINGCIRVGGSPPRDAGIAPPISSPPTVRKSCGGRPAVWIRCRAGSRSAETELSQWDERVELRL
jgi:hypothetical protein